MNLLLALTRQELASNLNRISNFCYLLDPYGTRYLGKKFKISPMVKMFILSEEEQSHDMIEHVISKECCSALNYSYFGEIKSPSYYPKEEMQQLATTTDTIIVTSNNSLSDHHCQQALKYYKKLGVEEVNLDTQNLISTCFNLQMKSKNEVS